MKPILWDESEEAIEAIKENFESKQIEYVGRELRIYPFHACSYRVEPGDKVYKDADGEPYIQEFKRR